MAIIFIILATVMILISTVKPLSAPVKMPETSIDVQPYRHRYVLGAATILATVLLYIIFW